jgi:ubiquinone/menaquinone biosynthesis C-methylase UbiE
MKTQEFDKFAAGYAATLAHSISLSGEDPDYFAEYKVRDVATYVLRHRVIVRNILDFGCGTGGSVPYFRKHFARSNLTGVDISQTSLDVANTCHPNDAEYCLFDGELLPFGDNVFDVVFAACVFHHVPAEKHVALLSEMRRVLSPYGVLFLFEHNPLNPLTVRTVNSCPFDEDAVLISAREMMRRIKAAQLLPVRRCYRIFFPRLLKRLRIFEQLLGWCPLGAQYYLCARK